MKDKYSNICITKDGSYTLLDPDTNEMYHSSEGARFESRSLYIESSGIISKLNTKEKDVITVLDVGLGLGYNAISTVSAWLEQKSIQDLEIISLEIDPDLVKLFTSCTGEWMKNWDKDLKDIISLFTPSYISNNNTSLDSSSKEYNSYVLEYISSSGSKLHWTIYIEDALKTNLLIPYKNKIKNSYDFIWQDPFSPTKNPGMWSEEWFKKLKKSSSSSTKLMSYSVSGIVKENLKKSGWNYIKIPTPGIKRSWLIATPN